MMTPMSETRRNITYTGSATGVRFLVHTPEQEGVKVEWTPPVERRDIASAAEAVVVGLVTTGTVEAIKAGVRAFRARSSARIEIEGEQDDDD